MDDPQTPPTTTTLQEAIPDAGALRDELHRLVVQELLGPAGGADEIVTERHVYERYLVGMLAPPRRDAAEEAVAPGTPTDPPDALALELTDDTLAVAGTDGADDDDDVDVKLPASQSFLPASLGFSCCVAGEATTLEVRATWGRYDRAHDIPVGEKQRLPWRRQPMGGARVIPITHGPITPFVPDPAAPDVKVRGMVRRLDGTWIITLHLVNEQLPRRVNKDVAWLFQPELSARSPDDAAIFSRHLPQSFAPPPDDPLSEEAALKLRYRRQVEFAVGHGVGVHITRVAADPTRALAVSTRVVPEYDVGQTLPDIADLVGLEVDMRTLAESAPAALPAMLAPLTNAYAAWIAHQATRVAAGADGLAEFAVTAQATLANCRAALARIQAGIDLVGRDPLAAEAFRFMNAAMWQQRIHTIQAEAVRQQKLSPPDADVPLNRSWRPFQLAFILLNLPGLTDPRHPDRSTSPDAIADLLWFPTGGGKTEAYLGLTAYTLALRRRQGAPAGGDGVAVLMRYTLRLLTLQQFQRATALICACELLRRGDPARWGTTPFRLGLWVGSRTTPNTNDQSDAALKSREHGTWQRGSIIGGLGTPAQLPNCPWCGKPIDPSRDIKAYTHKSGRRRTVIFCGDAIGDCPFSARQAPEEGLPALVVDEDIYRLLPALLIATVDKFAQMPWNGATGMLFGRVSGWCARHGYVAAALPPDLCCTAHPRLGDQPAVKTEPRDPLRPPDLIIQDELHLISGPLGTLVGLYETAVDRLATWDHQGQPVRSKVVASTATVRHAPEQIHALFARQVRIFPPQGMEAGDNFFARQQAPSSSQPGRRYMGICAPGHTLKRTLIRVYVAYLAAAQRLYEKYGKAVDPWMTLVGYFNSIRELAGMKRLVDDDVNTRLKHMAERGLARRATLKVEELTSRRSATEIPLVLDQLEKTFDGVPYTAKPATTYGARPVDVLLATNMLSVGVDVKRLGLMVVAGQPKATAEYIQATGRVGRSFPGLVCTVLNWNRPRDLSHYEHFEHFHATFDAHVEALSVTPFAPRALDRGLSALLVTLTRLLDDRLMANEGAEHAPAYPMELEEHSAAIIARALTVTGNPDVADLVRRELDKRTSAWQNLVERLMGGAQLGYAEVKDGVTRALLHHPQERGWHQFTCLDSLRDVEAEVNLILEDHLNMARDDDRPWCVAPLPPTEAEA
jgi:hypothetical protein